MTPLIKNLCTSSNKNSYKITYTKYYIKTTYSYFNLYYNSDFKLSPITITFTLIIYYIILYYIILSHPLLFPLILYYFIFLIIISYLLSHYYIYFYYYIHFTTLLFFLRILHSHPSLEYSISSSVSACSVSIIFPGTKNLSVHLSLEFWNTYCTFLFTSCVIL